LVDSPRAGDPLLVEGIPSVLNRLLADREIDVAPASSIEYALHADRYRILPDLVIGSRGRVGSILLVSDRPAAELDGALVALPTASATSVVLLKILLAERWRVAPRFRWFDQAGEDPIAAGAAAALYIGDVALGALLQRDLPVRLDLGREWWEETRLPFAFALWQTSSPEAVESLRELHATLVESRAHALDTLGELAVRHAPRFGLSAGSLQRYWSDLTFELDPDMREGLRAFYRLAAEIGEIASAPDLRWID
jgi:chorismate dehydratase